MEITGYRIDKIIGQGGMATVYRAEQTTLHRPVALKVLHEDYAANTQFAQHFLEEGRTTARLHDPQIVTVHDTGVDQGHYYLAMEYLPGGTLQRRISQGLTLEHALNIAEQIGRGLAYAHSRNIIHCDIKPGNILFRASGDPVITDFGIARPAHQSSTSGLKLGSPRYMSPEQARDEELDARSDLYSLGIIIYEMLIGQPPYVAQEPLELAKLHLQAPIPQLPEALAEFQTLIDRLLAKQPEQRYTIAEQFLEALKQARETYTLNHTVGTMRMPAVGGDATRTLKLPPQPAAAVDPDATRQQPQHRVAAEATTPMPVATQPWDEFTEVAPPPQAPPKPSPTRPARLSFPLWSIAVPLAVVAVLGLGVGLYGLYQWWSATDSDTSTSVPVQQLPYRYEVAPVVIPPPAGAEPPPVTTPPTVVVTPVTPTPDPLTVLTEPPREHITETPTASSHDTATLISTDPDHTTVDAVDEIPEIPEATTTATVDPLDPPPSLPPISPSDGDAMEQLLQAIEQGDYTQSLALLDRQLESGGDTAALRGLRQQLRIQQILKRAGELRQNQQLDQALAVLAQGLREFPDDRSLQTVQQEIRTAVNEQRDRRQAEQHLARARELYAQGQLDAALEEIEQGLQRWPRHTDLRILRARIIVDHPDLD